MKKLGIIILSLCLMIGGAGCSDKPAPPSSETGKKELVMATEAGFAPYEYYDGDNIVGVDVDIAKEIAKEMNIDLKIIDMDFGAITTAISSGKADFGAAGMSITEERKKSVDFSTEYAVSQQVIIVKKDGDISSAEDLNSKNVGVQLGTVADFSLKDYIAEAEPVQYLKYADAANDLINGRINAIVMDKLPAQNLVGSHSELEILEEPLFTDKYALAVKKGDTETLEVINKVLERLIAEGKIEEYTLNHTTK